jgi:diketogulonate reductase-like aldo/keto reductase
MSVFDIAPDSVDPATVPAFVTSTGAEIPAIGLGTFGSDHASPEQVGDAVREALSLGYRHLDCARVYRNEHAIGRVLADVLDSGALRRENLWLTSKLWNDMHGDGDVLLSVAESLRDLRTHYLDLYLVHWPFPNHHDPGVGADARHPDSRPYIHESYMNVWRQMERLVDSGLVRYIGTSNMTIPKLELLLRDCRIKPAFNEMELHPHFQQPELFDFCRSFGIQPIGYSPLGSPARPERDRTPDDTVDLEDPVIVQIADDHGVHPALIALKWAVQRGQITIPMSTKRSHIRDNLVAVSEDPLSNEEMNRLASIDRNNRLIKGHVFLWQGAAGWEDLWDLDGTITANYDPERADPSSASS